MKRRSLMFAVAALPAAMPFAWAHHGWSSFDQDRPLYLEGTVVSARWVMSSTLPTPLIARYLGAAAGSALAQFE